MVEQAEDAVSDIEAEAYKLAEFIEVIAAKREASAKRQTENWEAFFDRHAATELGTLIFNRMSTFCRSGQ